MATAKQIEPSLLREQIKQWYNGYRFSQSDILDYPNTEVKISFQKYLLNALTKINIVHVDSIVRGFTAALQDKKHGTA